MVTLSHEETRRWSLWLEKRMLEIPSEGGFVNSRPDTTGVVAMVLLARVSKRNFLLKFFYLILNKQVRCSFVLVLFFCLDSKFQNSREGRYNWTWWRCILRFFIHFLALLINVISNSKWTHPSWTNPARFDE